MAPILLLTTEPLPLPGLPATGAGLRAWGLAQGLLAAGLEVRLLMPAESLATHVSSAVEGDSAFPPAPDWVEILPRARFAARLHEIEPDVVVLQHWGLARELGEIVPPLAIDLAGPHLLERRLWGSSDFELDLAEKLDALRRADFVTCSGRDQRHYFLPFLAQAGWPFEAPGILPVIPFSMLPAERPAPANPHRLFCGGFFLPWQDPSLPLRTAIETLEATGVGELLWIGGPHPGLDVSRGRFDALATEMHAHPRVRRLDPISFDAYQTALAEGGVALDLMARNPERELAFATRTVAYLAAGLPVIHNHYSELAPMIEQAGAGWTLDPADPDALRSLLQRILSGEEDLETRAQAAVRLVQDRLDWRRTATPLIEFCRAPRHRDDKMAHRLASEEQGRRLARAEKELHQVRGELAALKGKRWVGWGLALTSGRGWLRWPLSIAAMLIGLALWPLFRLNDLRASDKP